MIGLIKTLASHTFVRYAFSGALALGTEEVVLFLAHGLGGWPVWLATALAQGSAFVVNFLINRLLTFAEHGAKDGAVQTQTMRFAILVAVNFGVTQLLMYALTHVGVNYLVAKAMSTLFITLYNFWVYKHWVFKPEPAKAEPAIPGGARPASGADAEAPARGVRA